MVRFIVLIAALLVLVFVFFPDEMARARHYGGHVLEQFATGIAGYYGALAR